MIIKAIVSTPWWVFPLLAYLIIIGIQSFHTRIVSLYRTFTIPLIFLCLSIYTLLMQTPNYIIIFSWMITILLGSIASFYQVKCMDIKVDTKHFLIQLPGNWHTLILMLAIFSSKYYFGYDLAVNPHHAEIIEFKVIMISISGFLTGLLQGKLIGYLYLFKSGINFNLRNKCN